MISRMRSRVGRGRVSLSLILSYVLDWIVIILAAVVGGIFSIITPNKRPFSLVDPDISFPYVTKEKISTATLVLCGLVAPVVIIFLITIFLVPGPTVPKSIPKGLIWRRKLWELHTGWLGLGLSLVTAFLITNGMKNLFGKPRVSYPVKLKSGVRALHETSNSFKSSTVLTSTARSPFTLQPRPRQHCKVCSWRGF